MVTFYENSKTNHLFYIKFGDCALKKLFLCSISIIMLIENDKIQLAKKGISQADIFQQMDFFKNGFPWMNLGKAATPNDGVLQLSSTEIDKYQQLFDQKKSELSILKMVPASGAATRMFKSLFEHLTEDKENYES
jgi:hypothetical protein